MNNDWHSQAKCRGMSPDLFHPHRGEGADSRAAKQVCATCPVQDECLAWALEQNEPQGVWGGTTPKERRVMRRGITVRPDCLGCGTPFVKLATDRGRFCSLECRATYRPPSRAEARRRERVARGGTR